MSCTAFVNAFEVLNAGEPYSFQVTESSSVPRPMSANMATDTGREESFLFSFSFQIPSSR